MQATSSRSIQSTWSMCIHLVLGVILGLFPLTLIAIFTICVFNHTAHYCTYLSAGPNDFMRSSVCIWGVSLATLCFKKIRKIGSIALLCWLFSLIPAVLCLLSTAFASDGCMGKL